MALSDEFLIALGRVGVYFQNLESRLALLTWCLISPDQIVGQIVTTQLSFSRLCDLLSSLFRYKVAASALPNGPELIEELDNILRKAAEAEQRRNTITHSTWFAASEEAGAVISRFKLTSKRGKGLKTQYEETDAKELTNLADSIRHTAETEIGAFIERLVKEGVLVPGPLP